MHDKLNNSILYLFHGYVTLIFLQLYIIIFHDFSSLYDDVLYVVMLFAAGVIALRTGISRSFLIGFAALVLTVILSLVGAQNVTFISLYFIGRDYFVPFSLILITTSFFRSSDLVDKFILQFYNIWVPVFFITVLVGLIFPSTNLAHVHTSLDGPDTLRVASFLTNPNTFGYVLCILYSIAIQRYLIGSYKLDALYILFLFSLLLLTTSRSTFLLFGLITVLALILNSNKIKISLIFFVVAIVLLLFQTIIWIQSFGYLGDVILSRFQVDRLFTDNNRFLLWSNIIDEFQCSGCIKEVLTGHGATLISRGYQDEWYEPDNYYLKIYLEFGLLGLIIYIISLIYLLMKSITYSRSQSKSYNIDNPNFIYPVAVLVVAFSGATATILDVYPFNYLIYIIFGLYLSKNRLSFKSTFFIRN